MPEEIQYPEYSGTYRPPTADTAAVPVLGAAPVVSESSSSSAVSVSAGAAVAKLAEAFGPSVGHLVIPENSKGWSCRRIFADYLRGAHKITVRDPYIRTFFQVRNFLEFLQMVHDLVPEGDEVEVSLVTQSDMDTCVNQDEHLNQLVKSFTGSRVAFNWEFDHSRNFHARNITTDQGWKIMIDRGLDVFQ